MAYVDCLTLALVAGIDTVLQLQQGVIRRDQALAVGFSEATIDNRIRRKQWVKLLPRVYVVDGFGSDAERRIRAAWLWAGEDSVISGPAAAWWWGLTDTEPNCVEVVVPPGRRMSSQPGVDVIRGVRGSDEIVLRNRVAVTTPAATSLRLARAGQPDLLDVALRGGLRQTALRQALLLGWHRRGQIRARLSCAEVADNPWSNPERALHRMLGESSISGWTGNAPVRAGGRLWYPDVLFEEIWLVIEIDGRDHHRTAEQLDADRRRQNTLVEAGFTVLRFTPRQIAEEPAPVIASVRRTINRLRAAGTGATPSTAESDTR